MWFASAAVAQPATAPSIIAAEQAFERGLRAFNAGQFDAAHDAFRRVVTQYEYNQRTTSAHLMAGRALLAAGEVDAAVSEMTTFIARYPRSRYVEAARALRREAMGRPTEPERRVEITSIGILLPTDPADAAFTQALFNGIRLAVEAHNAAHPDRPARMVFRDSGGATGAAVSDLARQGVAFVIGPLYSEEAAEAARVAEREGLVMVTPLATEELVSQGRRFVFQANPTFPVRGRAMARFAQQQGIESVGVVTAAGTFADDMARAFIDQFEADGKQVAFVERLPRPEAWFQLPERLGTDRVAQVDAVYLPVTGASADEYAAGALRGLDLMLGEDARGPRILGNSEWQNLRASRPIAERLRAAFTSDYFFGDETPEFRAFAARYQDLAGVVPDRLAFKGYDLARMLLEVSERQAGATTLAEALRTAAPYRGLAHQINFGGGQVNQHLFLLRFRGDAVEAVR